VYPAKSVFMDSNGYMNTTQASTDGWSMGDALLDLPTCKRCKTHRCLIADHQNPSSQVHVVSHNGDWAACRSTGVGRGGGGGVEPTACRRNGRRQAEIGPAGSRPAACSGNYSMSKTDLVEHFSNGRPANGARIAF